MGGILAPRAECEATVPANIQEGFKNFDGYYVAPHSRVRDTLIGNADASGGRMGASKSGEMN